MFGWITNIDHSDCGGIGNILGSDGKFYAFQGDRLQLDETQQTLHLPQAVAFSVGKAPASAAGCPLVEDVTCCEETISPELATLQAKVRAHLSQKRFLHCFRVSKIARVFAQKCGCSPDKAEVAGLLHDWAKELTNEQNASIILESHWPVSSFELEYHHVLHAVAGAILVKQEFQITDPEILDGIRSHNGRPAMSNMEKVIFIADHIDKLNKEGANGNRLLDVDTIDAAIYRMILIVNQYFVKHHQTPDIVTECTMNYMLQSVGKAKESDISPDTHSVISDEIFDAALEIAQRQSVGTTSVPNLRQLGGYSVSSGRKTRNHCLIRSARLFSLSPEDAVILKEWGIDTIIDLRTDEEVATHPDRNVEAFRHLHLPLPSIELSHYQKQIGEKFILTTDAKEKSFYLAEYLNNLHMEDMYYEVFTAPSSITSLQVIFQTLLDPATHGVLFHCTSGKDRTGIVAALIMHCLGVSLPDIRKDYYVSALATFASTEVLAQQLRKEHYSATAIDEIRYYNGIGQNIAESVFQKVSEEYGGLNSYVTQVLGVSTDSLTALREKYLE